MTRHHTAERAITADDLHHLQKRVNAFVKSRHTAFKADPSTEKAPSEENYLLMLIRRRRNGELGEWAEIVALLDKLDG